MKLYYVANARMPTEKAHGIQIAKMCEAFIEAGTDVELVVPRRGMRQSLRDFYHLRVNVPIVRLNSIDVYNYGRVGYFLSSLSFMLGSLLFLWGRRLCGEHFMVYTVDLDNYSSSLLPLVGLPLFTEMHGGKPRSLAQRFLFRYVRGVFAINSLIIEEFKQKFTKSKPQYLSEPNGVDTELFASRDKHEARMRLGLPLEATIALYTGRFFGWKGLEILPQAAAHMSTIDWYMVGGSREDFLKVTGLTTVPANMHFIGSQAQAEIPWWLAAADALIVLGTKRDQQSYFYTSPMKLFEYLLSQRPIVASDTPAIRQVVSEKEVFFYEPDNAENLALTLHTCVSNKDAVSEKVSAAYEKGKTHSWSARAKRILASITASCN